ncbi:oxidoreductase-like domain-containing protein [Dyella marensis]|uniref:oxidoreductase-like domain-containing protein n=1 Tax=Dyella TaxID=231454 RepID=UPI00047BCAA2|nr:MULTISPECIES: oxidoreductase-like domain-containing protein [Dyella]
MTDSHDHPSPEGFAPSGDPRPVKPIEPDALDCCGEGCVPCIYDLYEAALDRYQAELAAWLERHPDALEN